MTDISLLEDKILRGGQLTDAEAYSLCDRGDSSLLRDAASRITKRFISRQFDPCSIVNARSGHCPENCKWCAQSIHYDTRCDVYELISRAHCDKVADINKEAGIRRFSFVTSGRALKGESFTAVCEMARDVRKRTGMNTCASLGLLDRQRLQELWDAGVHRYHCNLETAPSHFKTLCTTHTIDDKLKTIRTALDIGFEICSGGIIGMGETERQRVEFALALRETHPVSIPVNILCPIKGTPLQDAPLISDDEIIDTVAIMRMVHPHAVLRFAGGRERLSRDVQLECMRVGVSGAIIGDLLTTIGSTVRNDKELVKKAGYIY